MSGIIMALQLLAGLSFLVILHELGHFLAARIFGIKVEKFYLFFDAWGFKLFSFKKGDTEYGIGWLPLGGYVKIAGMIDESMDTEAMKLPPKPWEFRSKPAWQRLIVMLAGVFVNVLVGIFIFWMLIFNYGESYIPNSEIKHGIVALPLAKEVGLRTGDKILEINGKKVEKFNDILSPEVFYGNCKLKIQRDGKYIDIVIPPDFINKVTDSGKTMFVDIRTEFLVGEIIPGSPAESAGLKTGDKITAIDTAKISFFDQLQTALQDKKDKIVNIKVIRNGQPVNLKVHTSTEGKIGFTRDAIGIKPLTNYYSLMNALPMGTTLAKETLSDQVKGFGKIIKGEVDARKALQGPIGMAKIYGDTFQWKKFWMLTGLISLILAFMNILPIPALDGGHALFLLIEIVKGKPLNDSFMEKAQTIGFIILICLMVFAFGNDILHLFGI